MRTGQWTDKAFYLSLVAVVVAGALFQLWQRYLVVSVKCEIGALKRQYGQLCRERDKLRLEVLKLSNLARVAKEGKARGFVPSEPKDLIVVSEKTAAQSTGRTLSYGP